MPFGWNPNSISFRCPICKSILTVSLRDTFAKEDGLKMVMNHIDTHARNDPQQVLYGNKESLYDEVKRQVKISEVPIEISFKTMPTVTVQYDPNAEATQANGQGGNTYYKVPVQMDGKPAILPVSRKLLQLLTPIKTPTKLRISRSGEGFNISFTVEPVK